MTANHAERTPLTRGQIAWVLAAATLGLALHLPHLPGWLAAGIGFAVLLRGALLLRDHPQLSLPTRLLMTLAGLAGIVLQYRNGVSQEAGVAMLALFLALKTHELHRPRDAYLVSLLNGFVLLTAFIHSQNLAVAAGVLLILPVNLMALIALNAPGVGWRETAATAARLTVQALPFMAVLFILFPRIDTPLWGMQRDTSQAHTGLSEEMTPGSIAELSRSSAIAFRVLFEDAVPPQATLYWRGPVLARFDGRSWRPGAAHGGTMDAMPAAPLGRRLRYVLTMEAHHQRWLFALDTPGLVPPGAGITREFQLLLRGPSFERSRHDLVSYPDWRPGAAPSPDELAEALQLPAGSNPRALALGQEWQRLPAARRMDEALAMFRAEPFAYTLTPPRLGRDSVDEFLFRTRRGFCEHYAAAFVFLMRAAGVPARVVTGYQGGEVNPVDGYLMVRQSDAHAWAEVWLEGRGWLRIDPTGAILPTRIEQGIGAALGEDEAVPLMMRADIAWLRALRDRWEAAGNYWNQWVLGYTAQRQSDLLSSLGLPDADWRALAAGLTGTLALLMAALVAWSLYDRPRLSPLQREWRRLSRKLARLGLARAPWEGPLQYAARVADAVPPLAAAVTAIAEDYAAARYAQDAATPARIRRLHAAIAALPVQSAAHLCDNAGHAP